VRLVLDTNAEISALLWHGTPGKLIDAAQSKTVFLSSSAPLLVELRGVLARENQRLAKRRPFSATCSGSRS
jgi:putative PIN family toxin of toxin-antitoxin system